MRFLILFVACLAMTTQTGTASEVSRVGYQQPSALQFRDLFTSERQPSALAEELAGKEVTMVGFVAPATIEEATFMVLVGAPVQFCPYCEAGEDQEELPYMVVYPQEDVSGVGLRMRVRVTGVLETGIAYDEAIALPNFARLRDARIVRDQPAANASRVVRARAIREGEGYILGEEDN